MVRTIRGESIEGVSEVASVGGYVRQYQIDVNPEALRAFNVPLMYSEVVGFGDLSRIIAHRGIYFHPLLWATFT